MKWPDKFKVFGVPVSIEEEFLEGVYGKFDTSKIQIHRELHSPFKDHVLGHEIVHAWLYYSGLEELLKDEEVEALCTSLGICLVDFLKEYKKKT